MLEKLKIFFGFQEDAYEENTEAGGGHKPVLKTLNPPPAPKKNAVSLKAEIKIEVPKIYEDSLQIASYLRDNTPVIINLKDLDSDTGKRLIDFICGTAYAINGHMMKIGDNIFLFTPERISISSPEEKNDLEAEPTPEKVFIHNTMV